MSLGGKIWNELRVSGSDSPEVASDVVEPVFRDWPRQLAFPELIDFIRRVKHVMFVGRGPLHAERYPISLSALY